MADYLLGIDVGTSGVKAAMLNATTLKLEHVAMRSYDSSAEQDSQTIWRQTLEAIRESVARLDKQDAVKAIGLSGQMHGTVLYEADGNVIEPIINWQDPRCNEPLDRYDGKTTIEVITEIMKGESFKDLGIDVMASGFLGATLFHIKENDPTLFAKVKHAVLPTDFIRDKLLAQNDDATDQTNAFSTGLFNTRLNQWHEDFIAKLGLPFDIFPEVHDTFEVAGSISQEVAILTGLNKQVPVIYGGGDNQMSLLGSGLVSADSPMLLNIGTGAQVSKIIAEYKKFSGIDTRSFFDGHYALVGASLGGGVSYEWLRNEVRKTDRGMDYQQMNELAAKVEPGADGLRFCTGPSRSNPNRKMGFYGNTALEHSVGHKARAVMEGVLMDLYGFWRLMDEPLKKFIVGAGKGLQVSEVWSQIAADVFGQPIKVTDFENAVFGAALAAGAGTGAIKNLPTVIASIEYCREAIPNPTNTEKYQQLADTWLNPE